MWSSWLPQYSTNIGLPKAFFVIQFDLYASTTLNVYPDRLLRYQISFNGSIYHTITCHEAVTRQCLCEGGGCILQLSLKEQPIATF